MGNTENSNVVFNYSMKINARHLDSFGHVNNATYLQFYEDARWDFIEKGGYGYERTKKDGIGPVILRLTMDFKKELLNQEEINIKSTLKEMKGSKIMSIVQTMLKEDRSIASTLDVTMGMMDLSLRKLVTPPQMWMKIFDHNQ